MIHIDHTIIINAPIETVFAFATDPDNYTKWQNGVDALEYENEPIVGEHYTEVRKFMGIEMRTKLEITQIEENKVWGAKTLSGPVDYSVVVTYEPVDGGTKMTTSVDAEPGGFFKLAEGAVRKQLEGNIEEDSQTLKAMIENA